MNGLVGGVMDICYKNHDGPKNANGSEYVIVDFPQSTIPEEHKIIPGKPKS
jgi:hypothetical protein